MQFTSHNQQAELSGAEDRPIPFRQRDDLELVEMGFQGQPYWVVKNPISLTYTRLLPEQHFVFQALAETTTLTELRDQLQRAYPHVPVKLRDVQHLINDLHQKHLLQSEREGQAHPLQAQANKQKRKQIFALPNQILFMRLPGWYPEPFLSWCFPLVRWMFHPAVLLASALFSLIMLLWVGVHFETFRSRLPEFQQFFIWPNLLYLWLSVAFTKMVHELGHALTCKYFRRECHSIGIMIFLFTPTLYCDVTDSWLLKNKWKRIAIAAAGPYVEIVLSSVAVLIWWSTNPGLLHYLCLNIFLVSAITTVVFNLNPLMKLDGYYILSDYWEIPNLETRSQQAFSRLFAWHGLGIKLPADKFTPQDHLGWYAGFALASFGYRLLVIFGGLLYLYYVLEPYGLKNLALMMMVVTGCTMAWRPLKGLQQIYKQAQHSFWSPIKVAVTSTALVAVTACVLFVPVPWWVTTQFHIEPKDEQKVYALSEAELIDIHVQPGDLVKQDTVLFELESQELEDQFLELNRQRLLTENQLRLAIAQNLPDDVALVSQQLRVIGVQLAALEEQREELIVRAPCAGTVIAASSRPMEERTLGQYVLTSWTGHPLQVRNQGALVAAGTHLCSIVPGEAYEAKMFVTQSRRKELSIGQPILMRCDHLPNQLFAGELEELAPIQSESVPPALSLKYGGELPTTTTQEGHEQLIEPAYEASLTLTENSQWMCAGLTGTARIVVTHRSLAGWAWNAFCNTFYFRL